MQYGGTVPPNNMQYGGTVPPNNTQFGGTLKIGYFHWKDFKW